MNRICCFIDLLLLSALLVAQPLSAQDSTRQYLRPALVKTNLLGPFSLLVEVPTTARRSVQISVQRSRFRLFSEYRSFSITPEYRFYLSKLAATGRRPAPKGFYVSPYLKYRTVADESIGLFSNRTLYTVFYKMAGGGAVAGSQFISRGGFTLDAFVGVGYFPRVTYRITVPYDSSYQNSYSRPPEARPQEYRLDLRVGLCIGLAFDRPETL